MARTASTCVLSMHGKCNLFHFMLKVCFPVKLPVMFCSNEFNKLKKHIKRISASKKKQTLKKPFRSMNFKRKKMERRGKLYLNVLPLK